MRLKLANVALLFLVIAGLSSCHSKSLAPSTWSLNWFPWSDTYSSWNWEHERNSLDIGSYNLGKFPDGVKSWDFAVCSVNDPAKKVLVPLDNPSSTDSRGNHYMSLGDWTPGKFPVDKLEALGEGTFLCAILGDGQRYSNVSRVTINHSYHAVTSPVIRVSAGPPSGDETQAIAIWVVAAPNQEIHPFDVTYPFICVNGRWSGPVSEMWGGQNGPILPGTGYGAIVGLSDYEPPIANFKKVTVQIKIISDKIRQERNLTNPPSGTDRAEVMKQWVERLKGYTSETVTLSIDDSDTRQFDQAFRP